MNPTARWFGVIGALSAACAVGAGAFGAHALRSAIPADQLEIFETAARYQMYHALGLFAVAWAADRRPRRAATLSGSAFTLGTLVFSGSLYALALTGVRVLGAITPIGGVLFLTGWASLAWAIGRPVRRASESLSPAATSTDAPLTR